MTSNTVIDTGFQSLSSDLLGLHKKLTKTWWNIKSLEEYKRLGLILRGLRVQIFPAWEVDHEFRLTWETGLKKCSYIIIDMLIEQDKALLSRTKDEIRDKELKLDTFDKKTLVDPFRNQLKDMVDRYEKDIIRAHGPTVGVLRQRYHSSVIAFEGSGNPCWYYLGHPGCGGVIHQYQSQSRSVDFLDLRIGVCQNHIITTLFRKTTATNNLLHFESFHPAHLRKGIPKGQFIRIRRNCSCTEDFMRESRQLSNRFRERGYPRRIVSGAIEFSRNRPREEFLNPRMNAQVGWLEERRTSRIFCLTAILDVQLPRFAPIQPKAYFNCRSRNMVYALVCGCKKFYVGQTTQELRRRTQQHLSNIMTARADRGPGSPCTSKFGTSLRYCLLLASFIGSSSSNTPLP
ncbi:uncharacterized protein [Dendrobates tinctorius]|uniref:uncharacterized protein n=1 Tax=Dendrobates tinctorius TaxID=92724 RepID=UPI003CC926E2